MTEITLIGGKTQGATGRIGQRRSFGLRRDPFTPLRDITPRLLRDIAPWLLPLLLLAAWQAASTLGTLSSSILPSPAEVVDAGWRLSLSGELPRNIEISFLRAIAGLVVGPYRA